MSASSAAVLRRDRRRYEPGQSAPSKERFDAAACAAECLKILSVDEASAFDSKMAAARAVLILNRLAVEIGGGVGFETGGVNLFNSLDSPSWIFKSAEQVYGGALRVLASSERVSPQFAEPQRLLSELKIILNWISQRTAAAALVESGNAGFLNPELRLDAEEFGVEGIALASGFFIRGRSGENVFLRALNSWRGGSDSALKTWVVQGAGENRLVERRNFFIPGGNVREGKLRFVLQAWDGEVLAELHGGSVRRRARSSRSCRETVFSIESAALDSRLVSLGVSAAVLPASGGSAIRLSASALLCGYKDERVELRASLRDEAGLPASGRGRGSTAAIFFPDAHAVELEEVVLHLPITAPASSDLNRMFVEAALLGPKGRPIQIRQLPLACIEAGRRAAAEECPMFLKDFGSGHELADFSSAEARVFRQAAMLVEARFRLGGSARPRRCLLELFGDEVGLSVGEPLAFRSVNFGLFPEIVEYDSVRAVFSASDFNGKSDALLRLSILGVDGRPRAAVVTTLAAPSLGEGAPAISFAGLPARILVVRGLRKISEAELRCDVVFEVDFARYQGQEIFIQFDLLPDGNLRASRGRGARFAVDLAACAERAAGLPGVFQLLRTFTLSAERAFESAGADGGLRLSLYDAAGALLQIVNERLA